MWHGAWCWDEFFLPFFADNGYHVTALSLRDMLAVKEKYAETKLRIISAMWNRSQKRFRLPLP
jgi:hypothetical protein